MPLCVCEYVGCVCILICVKGTLDKPFSKEVIILKLKNIYMNTHRERLFRKLQTENSGLNSSLELLWRKTCTDLVSKQSGEAVLLT